jgi:hypothetical protein
VPGFLFVLGCRADINTKNLSVLRVFAAFALIELLIAGEDL